MAVVVKVSRGTKVLGLACAALASVYLFASGLPVSATPRAVTFFAQISQDAGPAGSAEAQLQIASANLDMSQITSRPMFREGRRPMALTVAEDVVAAPQVASADRSIFEARDLVGIVEENEHFRILLSSGPADKTVLLDTGEAFGPWIFDHIEGNTAVFVAGDEEYRLDLKERSLGVPAGALVRSQPNSRIRKRGRP